jgi:hypothetical protein
MEKLKISIKGETINLCQPTKKFAGGYIWYKWLNDPFMNNHLDKKYRNHKNTKKKQIEFFINHKKEKRRIFIISTKNHIYKGVVSLSNIDDDEKNCDIAVLTDTKIEPLLAPYAGLEAIALISNFAFTKLKLKRIDCNFKKSQKNWFQRMEILGYKFFFRSRYKVKSYSSIMLDKKVGDERIGSCAYFSSLSYEDFKFMKKKRGKLWDNLTLMKKRISKLPKKSFWEINDNFLDVTKRNYYKKIQSL